MSEGALGQKQERQRPDSSTTSAPPGGAIGGAAAAIGGRQRSGTSPTGSGTSNSTAQVATAYAKSLVRFLPHDRRLSKMFSCCTIADQARCGTSPPRLPCLRPPPRPPRRRSNQTPSLVSADVLALLSVPENRPSLLHSSPSLPTFLSLSVTNPPTFLRPASAIRRSRTSARTP